MIEFAPDPIAGPIGTARPTLWADRHRRTAVDAAEAALMVVRCGSAVVLSVTDAPDGPELRAAGLLLNSSSAVHLLSDGSLAVHRDGHGWQRVTPSSVVLACRRHPDGHLVESVRLHQLLSAAGRRRPLAVGVASVASDVAP